MHERRLHRQPADVRARGCALHPFGRGMLVQHPLLLRPLRRRRHLPGRVHALEPLARARPEQRQALGACASSMTSWTNRSFWIARSDSTKG